MSGDRPASDTYILFELSGTTYALRSQVVRQMEMVEEITPVPNAPAYVEGVVFSRGQVLPVVNLRLRFGFAKVPHDLKSRLIVVAHAGGSVALLVDSAREFVAIPDDAIRPPPEALAGGGNYLQGIVTLNGRLALVLDVNEVLNSADVIAVAPEAR